MRGSARDSGKSARAILDAWREQRADRVDPVRFQFIAAMESRAADHRGEVRRKLDERLFKLLDAYAGALERSSADAVESDAVPPCENRRNAPGALGALLDDIGRRKAAITNGGDAAAEDQEVGADRRSSFRAEELPALTEFRQIWSQLRTDGQLRQSLQPAPANAGPLNSGVLVHRSIVLMRELSPGYLQHLLSYVDTLSWMEQMQGEGVLVTPESPRTASGRKSARPRSRRRGD
jgi:hypothetical protein